MSEADVAVISAIVAVVACVVSVWESHSAAKHNRKSVKPLLRIDLAHSVGPCQLTLVNAGLGPAVITAFAAYVDRREIAADERGQMAPVLDRIAFRSTSVRYAPCRDDILAAGEKCTLLEFCVQSEQDWEVIRQQLSRVRFRIDYKSVYGEPDSITRTARGIPVSASGDSAERPLAPA